MVFQGFFQLLSLSRIQRRIGQLVALLAACSASAVLAQAPSAASAPARTVASGPAWNTLSPAQHLALAPLSTIWSSLTEGQKRKWIALAPSYATLSAGEQEKMHSRMAAWAALSPKERAVARLNFEKTRKLAPEDLSAKWEAYQALPAEERQRLASEPVRKPVGAAVGVRPIPASKMAEVPVPHHTQDTKGALVKNPDVLDRKTLLPKPPPSAPTEATKP